MIIRARSVLPISAPPIQDGAVVVQGTRVVATGRWDHIRAHWSGKVLDLGEKVLLPGLINAHCHLDYTMLRRAINPPKSFTEWIRSINGLKRTLDDTDYLRAIRRGIEESRRWGTTTIFNIESFPELLAQMDRPALRIWWFAELLDIRKPVESIRFKLPKGWLGGAGLSPHAPYTVSKELFRRARRTRRLITTHVAESVDEAAMFQDGAGPMFEFMTKVGRSMSDCGARSVIQYVFGSGMVDSDALLVHVNELAPGDLELLAGSSIVHCPRSHAYFRHRPFQWSALKEAGANVCLGTDSLASNSCLSMFEEMRAARGKNPWLSPSEILETVTINPARAIRRQGRLGEIAPGATADLIALPFVESPSGVYESVIENRTPVRWMMINGRIL